MTDAAKPQPNMTRRDRIRRSALWAALGDALGFITEGVDTAGVRRRAGTERVLTPVPWNRRIGGRTGPTVQLPAGCISDDTQLRLATSRSIGPAGGFDVETFAKIELPVWSSYALGAGKGSQEAAANLRHRSVTWATNFFSADRAEYLNGGGNGAAMRVQPHVWATPRGTNPDVLIADVIANAVVTHGHPRGILGAVFHAQCLSYTFEHERIPGPEEWRAMAQDLMTVGELVQRDRRLNELWLGQWETRAQGSFREAAQLVADEILDGITEIENSPHREPVERYRDALGALGAFSREQRGSGTKTSLLAALAAFLFQDPTQAITVPANALGTDTDTIATMAGAIAGAVSEREPEADILDRDYIIHEADRMWSLSEGVVPARFPYPNLLKWTPPKSASDVVGADGDSAHVAGLGRAALVAERQGTAMSGGAEFRWMALWFGQRILAKQRVHPNPLPSSQVVSTAKQYLLIPEPSRGTPDSASVQLQLVDETVEKAAPRSLHQLTDDAIGSGFDAETVGRLLLQVCDAPNGIESAIAYAAVIAKARLARSDRAKRQPE